MKRKASKVTLVTVLAVGLLWGTTAVADASTPSWPDPAWFAQFSQSAPVESEKPAQPEPEPEPEIKPSPEPKPEEPKQSAPVANYWLSPTWFNQYYSQNNSSGSVEQPKAPEESNQSESHQMSAQERQLVNLANQERNKRGTASLRIDAELSKWARIKSQDMIDNNYFAHESPTYGRASTMLKGAGISANYFGENLAIARSVTRSHELFMGSSIHRAQVLNSSYTHVGIGIAYKGSTLYVTQLFAAR